MLLKSSKVIYAMLIWLALAICLAGPANADTIATYTGNPYTFIPVPSSGYTTANLITATLTFANPLPADATLVDGAGGIGPPTATDPLLGLVESDGAVTYTLTNAGSINIWLVTGDQGQILRWFVGAVGTPTSSAIGMTTNSNLPPPFVAGASFDGSSQGSFGTTLAYNFDDPGTWHVTTTGVPEPSSLLMLSMGIFALVGLSLKKFFVGKSIAGFLTHL
jgi:hypothetical protein